MTLHAIDLAIIAIYFLAVIVAGFAIKRWATQGIEFYFLANRSLPWWVLGLAGCSSYIDIGGTMSMVGLMYYTGLKSIWISHVFWGWLIICFYMAFQAKWIRRSGVMTFAEWNRTRFGEGRDTEMARVAAALFLLVLMICNLAFIAVGIGKFAEEFLPFARWLSTLIVFAAVGFYVTLGGFFGVVLTDIFQTILIAIGAVLLTVLVFTTTDPSALVADQPSAWMSLEPTWTMWDGFTTAVPAEYQHFDLLGPLLLAGAFWLIFRVAAGPNVWDFQFFLTARSSRDAAVAGGVWTVAYSLRWILGSAFLVLGLHYFGSTAGSDAEKIMPKVLQALPVGLSGLFIAVLLAALMSTLDAMINVTSSVVVNDFLKRYGARSLGERRLVQAGQVASLAALGLGFAFSLFVENIIQIWEVMVHGVVTMILVPATFRWHWWRFGPRAFVYGMLGSAVLLALRVVVLPDLPRYATLSLDTFNCLAVTLIAGWACPPAPRDVLVDFYTRVRPFGVWGPIRREAIQRGLLSVTAQREPWFDLINGGLSVVLQVSLAIITFYGMLQRWTPMLWGLCVACSVGIILVFTWYRQLPARDEDEVVQD